ncbi:MAG: NUDIX domain-containing protein [Polyangiaceae bacterium]|nr:NUDIX domain-containing protein [Polyangiaceae bacterium]
MAMSEYYTKLRERIGSDLLLIPGVAALVRDQYGRILVQEKHDGSFSLPAGAIEPGETTSYAVIREVLEETGLHVKPVRIAGVLGGFPCRVRYDNGHQVEYVVIVFDCDVISGELREISDETRSLQFLHPDEAHARLAFPIPKEVFDSHLAAAYFPQP